MASTAVTMPSEALHQEPLADFILIRTDEVDFDDRLRPVDSAWAQAVGDMMARDGQDTPIKICRLPGRNRWTGVVGAHRHAGAVFAGIEYLKAEVTSANHDDRRLTEIRENLFRSDLSPLDRAAFVAEAVAIHKRRAGIDPAADGRAVSAAVRWQKAVASEAVDANATIALAYGLNDQVADQLGLSKRTIVNDLMLYRRLPPTLVQRLRVANHPAVRNASQLRAIAKLEPAAQTDVLRALVGDDGWEPVGTVAEALKRTQPAKLSVPKSPDQKRLNTFIDTFSRMSAAEQMGALSVLRGLLPKGFAIVEGNATSAAPQFPAKHLQYRDEALETIDHVRDLITGLEEDDAISGDRGADLYAAGVKLGVTRLTIAGNGFEIAGADEVTPAEDAADLRNTIKMVADFRAAGTDPDFLIREMIGDEADEENSVEIVGGVYRLVLDGISATANAGGDVLIEAWLAEAEAYAAEQEHAA